MEGYLPHHHSEVGSETLEVGEEMEASPTLPDPALPETGLTHDSASQNLFAESQALGVGGKSF